MTKNQKSLIRIALSALIAVVTLTLKYTIDLNIYVQLGMSLAAYLIAGYDVLYNSVRNLCRGKVLDENFLMTIATIGAFAIGEYVDAAAVMILYQTGEVFQRYAVGKSRRDIAALVKIRPEEATVVRDGEIALHPSEIAIGETIVVKPGEKIALDGVIARGECNLDTSAITGESLPRHAKEGDSIISGCINLDGVIYVTVSGTYDNSTVAKILDLVENATSQKAPAENFITKFSKYYTPIVVAAALLLGCVPPMITGIGSWAVWSSWLKRAMMFLFVSCPCALVISVPLGFFGGIAAASKRGILVKGSNYLEVLSKVDAVAFDKTGTLTKGNFEVTAVCPESERDRVLATAAIAEQYSNHPIALSICRQVKADKQAQVTEIAGRGLSAQTDNGTVLCGNALLMEENGIQFVPAEGGTVVYVAENGKFVGSIVIADELKEDAEEAIEQLHRAGCSVVMLTGDNGKVAQQVAARLKIDELHAELLPADKAEQLQQLKKQGKTAFVGDGINDAPVIAAADVGIAMGAMGSDAAIETADIVLMRDNPTAIATAIDISKRTMRIVTENIVFSLAVKFAVLVISAIGLLDALSFGLIVAVLADVGVCMLAILNSMRTMAVRTKRKKTRRQAAPLAM